MNWPVLIIVGILVTALTVFLFVQNRKDEKLLENELNNDYPKPRNDEGDIETEEVMK